MSITKYSLYVVNTKNIILVQSIVFLILAKYNAIKKNIIAYSLTTFRTYDVFVPKSKNSEFFMILSPYFIKLFYYNVVISPQFKSFYKNT